MIIRNSIFMIFFILIFSSSSWATKLSCERIEDLLKRADYVALVRIVSGEALLHGKKLCGAKYKGKVLKGIKGISRNEILEFGPDAGLEIGSSYLVFVTKPKKSYDPFLSTSSYSPRAKMESDKVCGPIRRNMNRVMHSGFGAMKVSQESMYLYPQEVARVRRVFVSLPDSLKVKTIEEWGTEMWRIQDAWVSVKDLIAYLKSIN